MTDFFRPDRPDTHHPLSYFIIIIWIIYFEIYSDTLKKTLRKHVRALNKTLKIVYRHSEHLFRHVILGNELKARFACVSDASVVLANQVPGR